MKIIINYIIITIITVNISLAQKNSKRFYHLIIGTYTKTQTKGIFVYKFDSKTGKLSFESNTEGIINPSYLAITNDSKNVFSVSESNNGSSVSAFDFDGQSGKLSLLNQKKVGANGACYVSIAPDNKYIFTANYGSGSISVLQVNENRSLGELAQLIQHKGKSVNVKRQQEPHAHSANFSPDGKTLYSADLGTDKLYAYNYDSSFEKPLQNAAQSSVMMNPGYGPRHFVFNKYQKNAYVINEMTAVISVFNVKDKVLTNIQDIEMNDEDFNGENGAADIHISNDGKFLYATNRGSVNEIVIFKINRNNGKLAKIESESTKGKSPRNFVIDPKDRFLLVANQNTDDIYVFKRNKRSGSLTYINEKITIGSPVCLIMTPVN